MAIAPLSKEDVLASFEKQFIDSAWHVEMFYNTTGERLTAILQDAGDTQRFAKARELMQTTLTEYRDALGKVAVEHFQQLARVAIAQPKWITGDPPHWARSYVERLITQELEPVGVMSLVDCWFRWFCDGPPKFGVDCGKPGWREPWTAPDWADNLERNPAGDYLADKRTAVLLRRERFGFSKRIEYLLDQAEHSARIELAASAPHTSVTEQMPKPAVPITDDAPRPDGDGANASGDSEFNKIAGPFWKAITKGKGRKRVPDESLRSVIGSLKDHGFSDLYEILEPAGCKFLKEYNPKNNRSSIKTLDDLLVILSNKTRTAKRIRSHFVKRLSRAAAKY
jgi:hypothetical protein